MTLLIVDDDYPLRSAVARWATMKDFDVLVAESATKALDVLESNVADVVILDVRLPDMDGLALAQQLIQNVPERPVIMMTAYADLEMARQSLAMGVYEYFTKPFEFEELGAGINRAMQHRKLVVKAKQHQALLEEEVARRTEELTQANARLQQEIDLRKSMQEKIVQLERLGALAEMSAGVSHNLNNVLTGILGPAQLIEMQTKEELVIKEARIIQEAALRATDIVRRLASAVGTDEEAAWAVDVHQVLHEAIEASRPRWKDESENMGIVIDLVVQKRAVSNACATPRGLMTVLINVIFNALDAMPNGGQLTIETKQDQDSVIITISDTGIGMNEETRRRVFEPFFTTKAHVGTGLGMATAFTSVSRWGGGIDLQSTLGKGTSVVIALPIWKADKKTAQTASQATRSGAVLIVEDENIVRSFLARVLSKYHQVDVAIDGFEALAYSEKQTYDVALIDLGMPGMPGDRVAQKLREHNAHIATVLITGWDLATDDARFEVFDYYLKKPFDTVDKILSVVIQAIQLRDERALRDT